MFEDDQWPASSPDMNPIEHLWPMVLRKLGNRVFPTREDLWDGLKQAFGEITAAQVQALYASMPRRIKALKKAKGYHTRY